MFFIPMMLTMMLTAIFGFIFNHVVKRFKIFQLLLGNLVGMILGIMLCQTLELIDFWDISFNSKLFGLKTLLQVCVDILCGGGIGFFVGGLIYFWIIQPILEYMSDAWFMRNIKKTSK